MFSCGPLLAQGPSIPRPNPGVKKEEPKKPVPKMEMPPQELPKGYIPPADPPEMFTKEILLKTLDGATVLNAKAIAEANKKLRANALQGLRNGDKTPAMLKTYKDWIRVNLAEFCILEGKEKGLEPEAPMDPVPKAAGAALPVKEERINLAEKRKRFLDSLNTAGRLISKSAEIAPFRQIIMQEVVDQSADLLENNFHARLHMVLLLGELDLTEEDAKNSLTIVPFPGSSKVLLKVLADKNQPDSIKIAAVRGLYRLLKAGQAAVPVKQEVTEGLVAALGNKTSHHWLQQRLAESLSASDIQLNLVRRPIVAQALISVVKDNTRDWMVRCEAARSLGRVPLDVTVPPVEAVRVVGQLGVELANEYQKNPADYAWRSRFWRYYLAFRAETADEKDAQKRNKAGLINNPSTKSDAEKLLTLIIPVVSTALNSKPERPEKLAPDVLKALADWGKANAQPAGAVAKSDPNGSSSTP